MTRTEWLLLIALSIPWGGSFFFFKVLADVLPPLTTVLGRVGIAAVALHLVLGLQGRSLWRWWDRFGDFALMAVLNNVIPFALYAWGETRVTSGVAAICNATTPIFTVLVGHFILRTERLTLNRGIGVATGFLGVALLVGPAAWSGFSGTLLGDLACLVAAAFYAFAGPFGRRFRDIPPLAAACGQLTASTIILLPVVAMVDAPWTLPDPGLAGWAALFGIALFSTAFAYLLFFRILATAGSTNLLLVTFLIPVTALLLGAAALNEPLTRNAALGMALIAAGLAAIDGRLFRI